MNAQSVHEAIEASDTDALLRIVDGLCSGRDWDRLVEVRALCTSAVARGKQVWGIIEHIRYRLALEAPAEIAGAVVAEGAARFTLGPLPEVAASTKTWSELAPYLGSGPHRAVVAAERVVRGDTVDIEIPDLPASLQPWEPVYPLTTYRRDRVETPTPSPPAMTPVEVAAGAIEIDDPPSLAALGDLVEPWIDQSNGRCQVVAVEGGHLEAIAGLGLPRARVGSLTPAEALSWMAWAGASGGAHGRRRGAAAGRYLAWWAMATLADLDWPAEPDLLGEAVGGMRFHWFDDGAPDTGWAFRLVISSPDHGLSWAIAAVDQA